MTLPEADHMQLTQDVGMVLCDALSWGVEKRSAAYRLATAVRATLADHSRAEAGVEDGPLHRQWFVDNDFRVREAEAWHNELPILVKGYFGLPYQWFDMRTGYTFPDHQQPQTTRHAAELLRCLKGGG